MDHFSDPAAVERYTTATPQRVPGYADLHRMALVLLSEKAPKKVLSQTFRSLPSNDARR
ncbi:conserved hypothetical protein [Roseobacter sp. GAI101]|nr:conserved hypothetical protein [Roseobacter sp. GAI101]